ncbi:unnamed protein product [Cylicocyclus nassatus]|uniref:Uncharacterized protein n=1 Tax=Cylicocyclus nassatus TaxID=53992 RepID=A0AA36GYV7_CYLNA|nr:unnamed protein product [Cylicocyclus nassatus]
MGYLMVLYYCVAAISSVSFIYSLYLILKVATPQMLPYTRFQLFIQICTFMETIHWTLLAAPVPLLPIFGFRFGGILGAPPQFIIIGLALHIDDDIVMGGGPMAYPWLATLATAVSLISLVFTSIIKHTLVLLNDDSKFDRSAKNEHRNALLGLIIQAIAVWSTTVVPVIMLCHAIYFPPSSLIFPSNYASCAALIFSLKSFNVTFSMIYTTKAYRSHFRSITSNRSHRVKRIVPTSKP